MTLLLMLLLKSLLVFALAGTALLYLRRASASARHLVCLLTLCALLALPLFSLTLPAWHLAGLQTRDAEAALPDQEPTPVRPSPALPVKEGKEFGQKALLAPAASSSMSSLTGRTPAKQGGGFLMQGGGFLLLSLYLLGVLLASLRPLLGLWGIAHLRRACVSVTDKPTWEVFADCAAALGLKRLPLLCRADAPVPMTWGWLRPVVLLPQGSVDWPKDRLRSVLLHEMAHIQRRDWPGHRLADFACALYWFHPLVWLTARRLRSESEIACDDLVLASGIPAPDYARHLLDIARALPPASRPPQSAIAMAQTPQIKGRILMVLDKTQSRRAVTRRALLVVLIPSAAALLTLSALQPDAKAQAIFVQSPVLAGVTDAGKPGSSWWSASGKLLSSPIYHAELTGLRHGGGHTVDFAFRLPANTRGATVEYKLPQSSSSVTDGTWIGKLREDAGHTEAQMFAATNGARIVAAEYPASLDKANIRVGIASGPWKVLGKVMLARNEPEGLETSSGSFIISPLAAGQNGFLLNVATSQLTQDIRIVGVDIAGRDEFPTTLGDQSIGTLDQITAHFNFPLVPLKEVRVETRPFQWIEYKDVALKPVK